jgi:hypothetical protein
MKAVLIFVLCFFIVAGVSCFRQQTPGRDTDGENLSVDCAPVELSDKENLQEHLLQKADSAKKYCRSKGFSEQYTCW